MCSKKLYIFITCLICILIFSCDEDQTKKYQDSALSLEKEIASKDSIIQTLSNSTKITSKKVDSLETLYKNDFVDSNYVLFLLEHKNLFVDKEKLMKSIISILDIENYDIMPQLFETSMFYKSYEQDSPYYNLITDKVSAISVLWENADRSPEAIKAFFTEKDKVTIVKLFENNSLYKDAGLYAIVKALITAYDEIEDDEQSQRILQELKSSLYKTQLNPDLDTDEYFEIREKQEDQVNNLISATVTDILSEENYSSHPESSSQIENRLFLVYSFWARRDKEGNKEVVYNLIKELHSKITKENFEEEEITEPVLIDNEYED